MAASETNQAWMEAMHKDPNKLREREAERECVCAQNRTDYGNGGSVPDRSRAQMCRTRRLGSIVPLSETSIGHEDRVYVVREML